MNILVTSVGKKVPLIKSIQVATKKISHDMKVIGCDSSPLAIAKYFADDFITLPSLDELSNELLLTLCRDNEVDIINDPEKLKKMSYSALSIFDKNMMEIEDIILC